MPSFSIRTPILFTSLLLVIALPVAADVLVTREGEQIDTRGPWEVRGRMVVFTSTAGQLSSIRLDEVDLEASERATEEALRPPEAPPPPPPPEAVMVLTDADVPRGVPAEGDNMVDFGERVQRAFASGNVAQVMQQVYVGSGQGTAAAALREELGGALAREISTVDVNLSGVAAVDQEPEEVDGQRYDLAVPPIGRIEVELRLAEPAPGEPEIVTFTFPVGEVLGSYRLLIKSAR